MINLGHGGRFPPFLPVVQRLNPFINTLVFTFWRLLGTSSVPTNGKQIQKTATVKQVVLCHAKTLASAD